MPRSLPGLAFLERVFGRGGILAYHGVRDSETLPSTHVAPAVLASHLEFLTASYDVLPLSEFLARRVAGRSLRNCVAITFDDAYTGILRFALPALERRRLPATVFVASGFCRRGRRFWWDRIDWAMRRASADEQGALLRAIGLAEHAAEHEIRDRLLTRFCGSLPRAADAALSVVERRIGLVPDRAMTVEELGQLARSDAIDFGCHTVHHYALPWISAEKAEREIHGNHRWLQDRLPRIRPWLAYPYGLYSAATIRAARRAGMAWAFSIEGRAVTSRFPSHHCSRIGIADVNTIKGMRMRLAWATIPLVAAQNGGWHPRLTRRLRTV